MCEPDEAFDCGRGSAAVLRLQQERLIVLYKVAAVHEGYALMVDSALESKGIPDVVGTDQNIEPVVAVMQLQTHA